MGITDNTISGRAERKSIVEGAITGLLVSMVAGLIGWFLGVPDVLAQVAKNHQVLEAHDAKIRAQQKRIDSSLPVIEHRLEEQKDMLEKHDRYLREIQRTQDKILGELQRGR